MTGNQGNEGERTCLACQTNTNNFFTGYWRPIDLGGPGKDLCSLKLADVEYFHYEKVGVIRSPLGSDADQYQISYRAKIRK